MINLKPSSLIFIGFLALCFSCQNEESVEGQKITLANTSSIDLTDKAITIQRKDLAGVPEDSSYPLVANQDGDTIPAQLDDLNDDGQWDELFFVTDLPSEGKRTLQLKWVASLPEFKKRTSIRFGIRESKNSKVKPMLSDTFYTDMLPQITGFQPYQTDGPTWENDKVGFRHYLDGRNSKDVFGKKASYMSPESVGIGDDGLPEDNYHVMEDWGRDILSVGNSVGIGGYGLMIGDSLARLGVTRNDSVNNVESTIFNIVTEGPVRSVINYQYNNWSPLDRTYQVKETTSIWPGMYAYKNSVRIADLQGDETLLVGLVNSNTEQPLKEITENDDWVVLYTHDKQTYEKEWWLGLALILPKSVYQGYMEAPETGKLSNTFLAKLKIDENKPIDYYAVACWELSDERFRDPEYFRDYVQNLVDQLGAEVKVTIEN